MRAFIAFDFDATFLDAVATLSSDLRARHGALFERSRPRWVERDAMHVTLRFLGDVAEARVPALAVLVDALVTGPAPDVVATRLGGFASDERARVLFAAVDGPFAATEARAGASLVALGFQATEDAYRPHLTLARLRAPLDIRRLSGSVDAGQAFPIHGRVLGISLYESRRGPPGSGSRYIPRASKRYDAS